MNERRGRVGSPDNQLRRRATRLNAGSSSRLGLQNYCYLFLTHPRALLQRDFRHLFFSVRRANVIYDRFTGYP